MHCFTHQTIEAVGACRACGKGLCPECTVDLGHSICCKGACEEKAQEMQAQFERARALVANSRILIRTQKHFRILGAWVSFILGLIYLFFGWQSDRPFDSMTLIGCVFLVIGLLIFILNQRLSRNLDRNKF